MLKIVYWKIYLIFWIKNRIHYLTCKVRNYWLEIPKWLEVEETFLEQTVIQLIWKILTHIHRLHPVKILLKSFSSYRRLKVVVNTMQIVYFHSVTMSWFKITGIGSVLLLTWYRVVSPRIPFAPWVVSPRVVSPRFINTNNSALKNEIWKIPF